MNHASWTQKQLISYKHLKKSGKIQMWSLGDNSFCNLSKKEWPASSVNFILLHCEQITFRFHFPNIRNILIFMIVGPSGRDHDSENQLYLTLETPTTFKQFKKHLEAFWKTNHVSGNLNISDIGNVFLVRKDACRKQTEDLFNSYSNILKMGPISSRTHELQILNFSIKKATY